MRGISTITLLLKRSLLAAALSVGSLYSFGQLPPNTTPCVQSTNCEPTDIYFDLPGGGGFAFGFNGDFNLVAAQTENAQSDFELRSTGLGTSPTTKTLYSPYFNSPGSTSGVIKYSFELSGTANLTSYKIYLQDAGGNYYSVCQGTLKLSSAKATQICGEVTNIAPALMAAGKFRFVFVFELEGGQNQFIDFDNFGSNIFDEGQITLPVNFTGLTAKSVTKGTQLTWNVADEINVSRYEVQKGSNGGDFKTIGIVFAGEKSSYTFTDEQSTGGVTFYRIRSVDIDGKFKYSTVISFSNGKTVSLLRAYPMPARNQVTLQHGAIEGKAQISISSENGAIVKRVVPNTGSMQTTIDLSTLKSGLYLLRLETSNGEIQTLKLVKQ